MRHSVRASHIPTRRVSLQAAALAAVCLAVACGGSKPSSPAAPAVTADTFAVVDGRQITKDDVEKAYRRLRDPAQQMSEEEALTAKLAVLNDLIVQDLLVAKAATLKIEVPQSELDTAYNNAKKNMADDAFQQELTKRNLTAADMREGLRRELLTQKVLEQEVGAKVVVDDKEISGFFDANRPQFNMPEESYHIAQIVVTPVREPQITNATGDDAATPQAAVAKAQMLMAKLKEGSSFRDLASGYSEDAESAPRGGDLGFVPMSRLKQAPPLLRNAVIGKTPGTVNVVSADGAHTLVLVVAHELAGQRDLSTPGVKERITETLKSRKEQLLRTAYLTAVRGDATVVNHLARRIVESKGAPPSLAPAAPK